MLAKQLRRFFLLPLLVSFSLWAQNGSTTGGQPYSGGNGQNNNVQNGQNPQQGQYNSPNATDQNSNGSYNGQNGQDQNGQYQNSGTQGLSPQQQQAQQIGYNAGYRAGSVDHQQGNAYNYNAHATYQQGSEGYSSNSGISRQAYKMNFQTGFENGYDDAFHGRVNSPGSNVPRIYSSLPEQNAATNPSYNANSSSNASGTSNSNYGGTQAQQNTNNAVHHAGTMPSGTVLSLQLNNTLSTQSTTPGSSFTAKVVQPVYDGQGNLLVPVGSMVEGTVGQVKKGGALTGTSSMALNFQQIRLPDGHVAALQANLSHINAQGKGVMGTLGSITQGSASTNQEGQVQQSNTRRTIGNVAAGTVVGTLLGALTGHTGIGAAVGAAAGLGAVLMTKGHALDLHAGTPMSITLSQPVYVQ